MIQGLLRQNKLKGAAFFALALLFLFPAGVFSAEQEKECASCQAAAKENLAGKGKGILVYPKKEPENVKKGAALKRPLPALSAKKIGGNDFIVDGEKAELEHFTTTYPFESVKDYYSAKLEGENWLLSGDRSAEDQLIYTKGSEYISVNKIAGGETGRTDFFVNKGKMPAQEPEKSTGREPLKEPDFIAVEPSLKQTSYIQDKTGKSLFFVYESSKGYEEIANFYRYQMQALGWNLTGEDDFGNITEKLKNDGNEEAKKLTDFMQKMQGSILRFNGKWGTCSVSVLSVYKDTTIVETKYDAK